jgi:beta-lactam-binding protein with PASTA domain
VRVDGTKDVEIDQLPDQLVGASVGDTQLGLDLADREARIRDREIDESVRAVCAEGGAVDGLLESVLHPDERDHVSARRVGCLTESLGEEANVPVPVVVSAHAEQAVVVLAASRLEPGRHRKGGLAQHTCRLQVQDDHETSDAAIPVPERVERLELVVRHGGGHHRVDSAPVVGAHPVDEVLDTSRQVVARRGRYEAGVVDWIPRRIGVRSPSDHHLAFAEPPGQVGQWRPAQEHALEIAQKGHRERPGVGDPIERMVRRPHVVEDLGQLRGRRLLLIGNQHVGERRVRSLECGRALRFPTQCRQAKERGVRQLTSGVAVALTQPVSDAASTATAGEIREPMVSVGPNSGLPGESVTADATEYGGCGTVFEGDGVDGSTTLPGRVVFYWNEKELEAVDISGGSASLTFPVPDSAAPGEHKVHTRCDVDIELTASAFFFVETRVEPQEPSVSVEPTSGPPGTDVTAVATRYDGCSPSGLDDVGDGQVAFYWDSDQLGVADVSDGSASLTFAVPELAGRGDHQVVTRCLGDDELNASRRFTVEPPVEAPVIVPDIMGMSVEEATDRLVAEGLALGDVSGVGDVIDSQDPPAGEEVPAGSTVDVTVVRVEPQPVVVPDLVGLDVAEVPGVLAERGLVLGSQSGDGEVVRSQDPEPGSLVPPGSAVSISVETEVPPESLVEVPDLTGLPVDEARAALAAAGLEVGDSLDGSGLVESQEPDAGTLVPVATAVSLTLEGTRTPWWPIAAAALVVLLGAGLSAHQVTRSSRDRRWLRRHMRLAPSAGPAPGSDITERRTEMEPPTLVVRLEVRPDSGTQVLEEVPRDHQYA